MHREHVKISVAKDFSRTPGPRYAHQGPYSGEKFRETKLQPAFRSGAIVHVDLDGTAGIGPSFLDEAFGGLVRKAGMSAKEVMSRLELKSEDDPSYIEEIMDSLASAA
jgi:hypothetical protein